MLFLSLGIVLIWYSGKDLSPQQLQQVKDSFGQTRFFYILPVMVALMAAHYSRALRWIILMEPLGYKPTKSNTLLVVLIGYFFNLLVPRLGEVMKCTLLGKYEKIAPDKLIGTIVVERAFDIVCLALVTVLLVVTQFDIIGSWAMEQFSGMAGGKGFNPIKPLAYLAALTVFIIGVRWIFHKYGQHGFMAKIKHLGANVWHGISSIKSLKRPKLFLLYTLLIWSLYFATIWLGFKAFPAVQHLGWSASLSILVFGSLGMIATQGGIGAYQFAVQKTLLVYGISAVAGLAFGWVLWAAQTAFVLFTGLLSLIIIPLFNRTPPHHA